MGRRLEVGERVVVVMARNDVFPWQRGPSFTATYRYGPSGPGDVFIVDADGVDAHPPVEGVHLNGNSSDFVAIYPAPEHGGERE